MQLPQPLRLDSSAISSIALAELGRYLQHGFLRMPRTQGPDVPSLFTASFTLSDAPKTISQFTFPTTTPARYRFLLAADTVVFPANLGSALIPLSAVRSHLPVVTLPASWSAMELLLTAQVNASPASGGLGDTPRSPTVCN